MQPRAVDALGLQLRAQIVMRDEISVKLCLAEERDAGIVCQNAVARDARAEFPAHRRQRLHGKEVRRDDGIEPVRVDIVAQRPGVARVCKIDRGDQPRRAIERARAIDQAKGGRRFLDDAVIGRRNQLGRALRAEGQRVDQLMRRARAVKRLGHGIGRAVVPLAGSAAEDQNLHAVSPPFSCIISVFPTQVKQAETS